MSPDNVLVLFRLPANAVIQRRVSKDDFCAQVAKPADRTLIKQRIESLTWHAALNHDNTALPTEGITGLAVVTLFTRPRNEAADAHAQYHPPPPRLIHLVHRAVPDPLILLTACETPDGPKTTTLSIKPSLGEALVAELAPDEQALPPEASPLLAVDRAASLTDLHDRWSAAVLGLAAFHATRHFPTHHEGGDSKDIRDIRGRRDALDRLLALDKEILTLTRQARRETQAGRRAELNERLQRARRERQTVAEAL